MNKYTGEKLDYALKLIEKGSNITRASKKMCEKYSIRYEDKVRKAISKHINKNKKEEKLKEKLEMTPAFQAALKKKHNKKKETFIITWAQNSTPVHKELLNNIEAYAKHLNAGVHVIAGRYKNPTSIWTHKQAADEGWAVELNPYLDASRHNLHEKLQVLSDVKISPTAATPLNGMSSVTGVESCIVGHPRQHLMSLPTLPGYPHKLLLSTGAITYENYTDSKAGKKGEFHHTFGFVVVELDGDDFHIRQVSADTEGNFYDLFHRVKNGTVRKNKKGCKAAVLGDIHLQHSDKTAQKVSFELLDKMNPDHTLIHDIIDCESINHHEANDIIRVMEKEDNKTDDLRQELKDMILWVKSKLKYNLVIVRSNHDDFLDRWVRNGRNWINSPNKRLYLECASIMSNEPFAKVFGVVPFLLNQAFGDNVKVLGTNDSFIVNGWELAMHGHLGANGSRGGANQFKQLNTKSITGHTHQPIGLDGHKSVGTLSLLLPGYVKGLSSWMHTNILIYPDGKAQHIHIINGKYCR